MSLRSRLALLILGLASVPLLATEVVWPTTLDLGAVRSAQDYLQPTVSGRLESATFGMVREEGQRFHEGVDIRPGQRDAAGEPLDLVRAAMDGQVNYVNPHVNGPYGRYVVLVHQGAELPVYTLYAHLASVDPAIRLGAFVRRGLTLGRMGRTSAGATPITPDRAHQVERLAGGVASAGPDVDAFVEALALFADHPERCRFKSSGDGRLEVVLRRADGGQVKGRRPDDLSREQRVRRQAEEEEEGEAGPPAHGRSDSLILRILSAEMLRRRLMSMTACVLVMPFFSTWKIRLPSTTWLSIGMIPTAASLMTRTK